MLLRVCECPFSYCATRGLEVFVDANSVLERFEALLGSNFRLHAEGMRPATVKLVEVTPVKVTSPEHARQIGREPFTVLFRCDKHPSLAQDTYVVEHPRLGANPLLITPVGPEPGYYEAIFS